MLAAELLFELFQGRHPAGLGVGQPALDSFHGFQFLDAIEELLIGRRVLNDDFTLPLMVRTTGHPLSFI
jgi:hypothetical protein